MDKSEVLIKVEGVSKKFCKSLKRSLWYGVGDISRSVLGLRNLEGLRKDEFWAVKDVSFEVRRGECLGLIGHNGAGKSTLLKMLNGLIRPDEGRIEMRGKVGALIELGAGFSPVLTGRENVYNNGAVLGFSKADIDKKFDEIVAFAEMADFIDMPVQNYSSGMKVRLGFAIASQMEPDILIIDEVLAVGDMGFVIKCFNRMDELLQNTAVILVSHSIPQVARMATKLNVMEKGKSKYMGEDVAAGINIYYSRFGSRITNFYDHGKAILEEIWIERADGQVEKIDGNILIPYGISIKLKFKIKTHLDIKSPLFYLAFFDREQRNFAEVIQSESDSNNGELLEKQKVHEFEVLFEEIRFSQGIYSITLSMSGILKNNRETIFRIQSAIYFQVTGNIHGWAPIQLQPQLRLLN
ncbi:ABC transporter ATP-binding protein [Algoriphagus formosus]|uniref:ABC transporter ATP-binding protein n=1 Tax=Algoriphagus formosus TaxID=2007308 RepID=UPI003F725F7E